MGLEFLKEQRVGDWVVIAPDLSHVIAAASTFDEALRKAGIDLRQEGEEEPRPVVMQVPDPRMMCLF